MKKFENDDSIFNKDFLRATLVRLVSGLILTVVSAIVGGIVTAIVLSMFD